MAEINSVFNERPKRSKTSGILKIILSKTFSLLHCLVPLNSVLFKPCQFLMFHISTGRKFYVTYLQFDKLLGNIFYKLQYQNLLNFKVANMLCFTVPEFAEFESHKYFMS